MTKSIKNLQPNIVDVSNLRKRVETMSKIEKTMVTFRFPFSIGDSEISYPPGTYWIETDYELLAGISFPVYRRKKVLLHMANASENIAMGMPLIVEPHLMDDAIDRDNAVVARM